MATKRTTKKTTKRPARKNAGLFGPTAVAKAKKVVPHQRVKEKETGQIGTVTGVKPGYLKVKWDGRTRQTLIRASAVSAVNPRGSSTQSRKVAKPQSKRFNAGRKSVPPAVAGGSKKRRVLVRAKVIKKLVINKANPAPRANSAAAKKFAAFQGRPATKNGSADVSSQAKGRGTMYPIGRLIKIRIRGVGEVSGAPGSFLLADTKDRLWISGKIGKARPGSRDLEAVGQIEHVVYRAHKAHIVDGMQDYIHKLGEETGAKPMLYIDPQGFGVIKGGAYSITPEGIVN